jgi:putative transposase
MRYRRDYRGNTYFFTLVTFDRQPILRGSQEVARLRSAFRAIRATHPFEISAMVVLPDHLHCIWQLPDDDSDFAERWMLIKRHFSLTTPATEEVVSQSRRLKRERAIWQRRYWEHRIRDEDDFARHLDYIHYNPVKHGYVASPWDWAYSSLAACARRGWYLPNWGTHPDQVLAAPTLTGE